MEEKEIEEIIKRNRESIKDVDLDSKEFKDLVREIKLKSFKSKVSEILENEAFRAECKKILDRTENFDEKMKLYEKIARIDDKGTVVPKCELSYHYDRQDLLESVGNFYLWIDKNTPKSNYPLINQVIDNQQYFTTQSRDKNERSFTGWVKKGNDFAKTIFTNPDYEKNTIGLLRTANHEFAHSFSQFFVSGIRFNSKEMQEVCPVIVDNLTHMYLTEKGSEFIEEIQKEEKDYKLYNIKKAREALAEACVVKVMTGEMTFEEAEGKYKGVFSVDLLSKIVIDIERHQFKAMYEGRYLIPQIIAHGFMENVESGDLEDGLMKFKAVLQNDTTFANIEEVAEFLTDKNINQLTDEFVEDLQEYADGLKPIKQGENLK